MSYEQYKQKLQTKFIKKLMAKVSYTFKEPYAWPICGPFTHFADKIYSQKLQLCHAQKHMCS